MANDNRFAVLIDADNISPKYIRVILDEISNDGIVTYKRIYGDWTNPALVSWKPSLLDHSVIPIQQYGYTTGKNSTDSAMIIDAMDILYSGNVDGFCIVSSDSDFTRLAARLRESGMTVMGMGERKTPKSFIAACNRFTYLDILSATNASTALHPTEKPTTKSKRQPPSDLESRCFSSFALDDDESNISPTCKETIRHALRTIVSEKSDEDGWMFIGTIGNLLVKRYPDFDVRNFGFSKLSDFLTTLDMFEIRSDSKNGGSKLIYIRLKDVSAST